ncbi:hypothetical protein DSO57_1036571 [Entomophthora muscae]|uniref:Uncharacterized protein n=1 Tax=Entomophthora muscae TaxID=34485 RepID=A0ACC2RQ49_9FUNG|nr:hypothetical protein DSO57_1036571 [Entomophthora muscae]
MTPFETEDVIDLEDFESDNDSSATVTSHFFFVSSFRISNRSFRCGPNSGLSLSGKRHVLYQRKNDPLKTFSLAEINHFWAPLKGDRSDLKVGKDPRSKLISF